MQLPIKAGWSDAPLTLRDLAASNLHDINCGRYNILLHLRFPSLQVPALTTHTCNSPLPVNPSPTDLHISSSKESPPAFNSPPRNTSSTVLTPLPELLPLGRHQATASPPLIPSLFSTHTSTKTVEIEPTTWQCQYNPSDHTTNPHLKTLPGNIHNKKSQKHKALCPPRTPNEFQ